MVIDHHVDELVARDLAPAPAVDADRERALAMADQPVAGAANGDTCEPLDVDVD
jgi:hypothetical protein